MAVYNNIVSMNKHITTERNINTMFFSGRKMFSLTNKMVSTVFGNRKAILANMRGAKEEQEY